MVSVQGRWLLYFACGVLALVVALGFFRVSEPFHTCFSKRKHDHRYSYIQDPSTTPFSRTISRVGLNFSCGDDALNADGAGITAIFTIVLSLTSILQWEAIRRQANIAEKQRRADVDGRVKDDKRLDESLAATKRSVEAAVGVEVARMEISSVRMSNGAIGRDGNRSLSVGVWFSNHGRTDAHVFEDCIAYGNQSFSPVGLSYPFDSVQIVNFGTAVKPADTYGVRGGIGLDIPAHATQDAISKTGQLWVYGYVAYHDFLDDHWRSEFCFIFDPETKEFVQAPTIGHRTMRHRYNPQEGRNHRAPHRLLDTLSNWSGDSDEH